MLSNTDHDLPERSKKIQHTVYGRYNHLWSITQMCKCSIMLMLKSVHYCYKGRFWAAGKTRTAFTFWILKTDQGSWEVKEDAFNLC